MSSICQWEPRERGQIRLIRGSVVPARRDDPVNSWDRSRPIPSRPWWVSRRCSKLRRRVGLWEFIAHWGGGRCW